MLFCRLVQQLLLQYSINYFTEAALRYFIVIVYYHCSVLELTMINNTQLIGINSPKNTSAIHLGLQSIIPLNGAPKYKVELRKEVSLLMMMFYFVNKHCIQSRTGTAYWQLQASYCRRLHYKDVIKTTLL